MNEIDRILFKYIDEMSPNLLSTNAREILYQAYKNTHACVASEFEDISSKDLNKVWSISFMLKDKKDNWHWVPVVFYRGIILGLLFDEKS